MYLLFPLSSEILLEERSNGRSTMDRENRRVAAMSWGGGDELPPPKPARMPITGERERLKNKRR